MAAGGDDTIVPFRPRDGAAPPTEEKAAGANTDTDLTDRASLAGPDAKKPRATPRRGLSQRRKEKSPEDTERALKRKKARALRKLQRLSRDAEEAGDASAWESEFVSSLEDRLGKYDAAFRDRDKGAADEPLSRLQAAKVREIAKKLKKAKRARREGDE